MNSMSAATTGKKIMIENASCFFVCIESTGIENVGAKSPLFQHIVGLIANQYFEISNIPLVEGSYMAFLYPSAQIIMIYLW